MTARGFYSERWKHIILRHPELKDKIAKILVAVANPDETYVDPMGAVHVLKRLAHEISDYLVVMYRKEDGECYIELHTTQAIQKVETPLDIYVKKSPREIREKI